jgi:apolipoprotein N-acyltransferase
MSRIAGALLSALLYAALFPPVGAAPLAWLALVPFALSVRGASPRQAAAAGFAFGAAATLLVVVWLLPTVTGHFERSAAWSVAFWLGIGAAAAAPFYASVFALAAPALARAPAPVAALLFAACWVAAEWLRCQLGLRSSWALLGASQSAWPRVLQVADLGGVYAVGAAIALVNGALAEGVWALRAGSSATAARRHALVAVGLAAAVLAGVLVYGQLRMSGAPRERGGFEVAVVQGDVSPALRFRRSAAARALGRYARLTLEDGAAPPDLVIWPESALQLAPDDPLIAPFLDEVLRRAGAPLLLGAPRHDGPRAAPRVHNSAFLVAPERAALHYDKRVLLPFSETRPLPWLPSLGRPGERGSDSYERGTEPGLFDVAGQRLGILICLEALYPELAREAAREGASVLVNLSHDGWYRGSGGPEQHLAQAVLRAVETRRPLVRSTTTGISAVVAPDGRIAAALPRGGAGVLRAAVPAAWPGASLYVRAGDLFAGLCLASWAAAAGHALATRCRSHRYQRREAALRGVGGEAAGTPARR